MEYTIERFEEKHIELNTSFYETLKNLSDVLVLDMKTTANILQKIRQQGGNIFVAVSNEHGII